MRWENSCRKRIMEKFWFISEFNICGSFQLVRYSGITFTNFSCHKTLHVCVCILEWQLQMYRIQEFVWFIYFYLQIIEFLLKRVYNKADGATPKIKWAVAHVKICSNLSLVERRCVFSYSITWMWWTLMYRCTHSCADEFDLYAWFGAKDTQTS